LTAKVVVAVAAFAEPEANAKSPRAVAYIAALNDFKAVIVIPLGKARPIFIAWDAASKPDALVRSRLEWKSKIAHIAKLFSVPSKIAYHMTDLYASLWALNQAGPK
jgi:hypothetical protein